MDTAIKKVTIGGFRGFSRASSLVLGIPDGRSASGLTVLVGPNNSGKSSVVEALKLSGVREQPKLGRSVRNETYGDIVQSSMSLVTTHNTNCDPTIRARM
jgi:predicted ATP-dependent endonuclease of OLD family